MVTTRLPKSKDQVMRTLRFRGFTIIELLVVISIIGILVALLLPAVQRARAQARSVQCRSRLKQIAIALDHYHSRYRMFPAGRQQGNGFSALVAILPDIEQENLYNTVNFLYRYSDPQNSTVAGSRVDTFSCPADSSHAFFETFQTANYMGNAGTGLRPDTMLNRRDPVDDPSNLRYEQDGIFWSGEDQAKNRSIHMRSQFITDGLSNTVIFSETIVGIGGSPLGAIAGGKFPDARRYFMQVANTSPLTDAICQSPASAIEFSGERGNRWVNGSYASSLYNHYLLPNDMLPDCISTETPDPSAPFPVEPFNNRAHMAARSWHPGRAVNVVFVDGRSSSINPEIDKMIWRAISTRAGGESAPNL